MDGNKYENKCKMIIILGAAVIEFQGWREGKHKG